jgi:hypothetical protein
MGFIGSIGEFLKIKQLMLKMTKVVKKVDIYKINKALMLLVVYLLKDSLLFLTLKSLVI